MKRQKPVPLPEPDLCDQYGKIGISAVAGALEASTRKPQKPGQGRKDIPAVLRGEEAA